jgi:hypothetical protein
MTMIRVNGRVTEAGEVQFELPDDVPAGDVEITIRWREPETLDDPSSDDIPPTFTDEELAELNKPQPPVPGHLIETGIWEDSGITDSVEWIRQQREARAAKLRANHTS